MSDPKFVNLNPQITTVCAFLGGASFTALVIFTQSSQFVNLNRFLIPMTAVISFLFILVAIGTMKEQTATGSVHISFYHLTKIFLLIGIGGLMMVIATIVYEYAGFVSFFVVLSIEMSSMALLSIFTIISDSKKKPVK